MSFRHDTQSSRIVYAIGISILIHGLLLWGPNVKLPNLKSSPPPLVAKLQALPNAPAKHEPKRKPITAPKPKVIPAPQTAPDAPPVEDIPLAASAVAAASSVADASNMAAASAPPPSETLAQPTPDKVVERPPLPRRAQLTFAVNKGTSNFKIGEAIHTLEIDDGHYVLQSVTETVGLAKIIKTYKLTQYSSGNYSDRGLQPEKFFEERADGSDIRRNTAEFDHAAQRAHFLHDGENSGEATLPPDTQDILSILYQFPPLAHAESVTIFVSNGKKIERYEFEIAPFEDIQTAMGVLHTVHLRKLHQPNEEGLEVWLALEYRLFPVKMRIIEKNGEISGEAVITDIRAELN